ncbi:MAG: RHS repeat protein, partial [Desulfofustis sp. PB-SRB1]|nr:RHS repeat protein [Desulfofustis sp. PB-SRB1]
MCRLIAYTDPEGNERRFEYDAAGHLTARINPEGGTYRYIYDDEGRLQPRSTNWATRSPTTTTWTPA